jgi:hypothetical protein
MCFMRRVVEQSWQLACVMIGHFWKYCMGYSKNTFVGKKNVILNRGPCTPVLQVRCMW